MLKVYNTLTNKKEIFRPRKKKKINLFVCGPTVYDYSHLGHARTYIAFDVIVKYLRKEYDLFYLQNITDIDDKIIKRAQEQNISPKELAQRFEKEYKKDMKSLKVDSVTKYAQATQHIKEIINQVERLIKKGFAYQLPDGLYYDVNNFKDYGKLAKRTVSQAEDGLSRIDEGIGKKNKGDFCLWKFSKEDEPKWPSPWGWGRPGWHIEDTAISEKYFGQQYDIHGGARDLIFPHHEAEIAQMEALSNKKPFVKYWFHSGFLTVQGRKMSKSLGNFITIRDFLKEQPVRLLRLFVIKAHYRSPIDYNKKALQQAEEELKKIDRFISKLKEIKKSKTKEVKQKSINIKKYQEDFAKAMADDFNTSKVVALIFNLLNETNNLIFKNQLSPLQGKEILNFLKEIDTIFGFIFVQEKKEKLPQEITKLIKLREEYRKKKNWTKADAIRLKIEELGYQLEDTKKSSKVIKNK